MIRAVQPLVDRHAAWMLTVAVALATLVAVQDVWQTKRQQRLTEHARALQLAWDAAAATFYHGAEEAFFGTLSQPQVVDLMFQANLMDGRARDLVRGRLYRLLWPYFERLHRRFASQVHFHLASGESLLRLYLPELSGQGQERPLVMRLLRERRTLQGFEVGATVGGLRTIFPLWRGDEFVGAVEIAVSGDALVERLRSFLGGSRDLAVVVSREAAWERLAPEARKDLAPSLVHKDFLTLSSGGGTQFPELWVSVAEDPRLQSALVQGEAWTMEGWWNGKGFGIVLLPVSDVTGQHVGFVLEAVPDPVLERLSREVVLAIGVILVGAASILVLVWRLHQSRAHVAAEAQALAEANAKLQRTEAQSRVLATAVEQTPVAVWVADSERRIVFANAAFGRLVGRTPTALIGQDIGSLGGVVHDVAWELERIVTGRQPWSGEIRRIDGSGQVRWLQATISPVQVFSGQVCHVVGVEEDISVRKEMESQLRQTLEFLEVLLATLPVAIAVVDAQTRVVEQANPELANLLGLPLKSIMGQDCQHTICSGARACPLALGGMESQAAQAEHTWRRPDGSSVEVLHTARRIWVFGEEKYVECFVDISERKAAARALADANAKLRQAMERAQALAEAAESASQAKGRFLATMSHEIRTPMHAVLGMLHLALQTPLSAKQREYLHKAQQAAQALLGLLNDILDFSKIEAGKLALERTPVAVWDVLDTVATVVGERLRGKDVELIVAVEPSVPWIIQADGLRLTQILVNVAGNAAKFTEHGEVEIRLWAEPKEAGELWLHMAVRDTGIGMSPQELARVLEPFAQAESSTARRYGGTGLGLAIAAELVRLMGGTLHLESRQGEGTTVYASIVCGMDVSPPAPVVPSAWQGKKVAIVGGQPAARSALGLAVQSLGLEPVLAPHAGELTALGPPFAAAVVAADLPPSEAQTVAEMLLPEGRLVVVGPPGMERSPWAGISAIVLSQPVLAPRLAAVLVDGEMVVPRAPSPQGWHGTGTILVAEDNPLNQQVIQGILEGAGFTVRIVGSGTQALAALAEEAFDVVLMDVEMPDMDGVEATRRARAQFPDLPIIAMTAHALAEDRERFLDAGFVDHVAKPMDVGQLFAVLGRFVPVTPGSPGPPPVRGGLEGLRQSPDWDVDGAVERMGGDVQAYVQLLQDMAATYAGLGQEVQQLVIQGETAAARAKVHSLRGIAGNVGAMALCAAAASLEEALGQENAAVSVDSLQQALADFVRQVQEILGEGRQEQAAVCQVEDIAVALDSLVQAIEARRPKPARQAWDRLRGCFGPEVDEIVREMDRCLMDYAFDQALGLVERLRVGVPSA